jgi:hypothetical protein
MPIEDVIFIASAGAALVGFVVLAAVMIFRGDLDGSGC